jgi:hypothetical protein
VLGEDYAAACPGTDDVEGQAEAGAGIRVPDQAVGIVEPFSCRAGGRMIRRYMSALLPFRRRRLSKLFWNSPLLASLHPRFSSATKPHLSAHKEDVPTAQRDQ